MSNSISPKANTYRASPREGHACGSFIRTILKGFGTDEAAVDEVDTTGYLRSHTEELDLAGEIEEWRDELVRYGLDQLTGDSSDPND